MGKQIKKHVLHNYAINGELRNKYPDSTTSTREGGEVSDPDEFVVERSINHIEPTEITFTIETSDEDEFPAL